MSKVLLISDSHMDNKTLYRITTLYKDKVDYIIHAGDSCLPIDTILLKDMDVVRGNHDYEPFSEYIVHPPFFICHGHTMKVYETFDVMLEMARKNGCDVLVHGHTHIGFYDIVDGIQIINPGSIMFNRGSYGYGTYAIYDLDTKEVHFYHSQSDQIVDDIVIPDGKKTLQEFRDLLKDYIARNE